MNVRLKLGPILLGGLLLGAAAAAIWWFLDEPTEAERRFAEAREQLQANPPENLATEDRELALDRAASQLAADRWYEELVERHSDFQVDFKEVPDDENGFLQLLVLAEELEDTEFVPSEIRRMLGGSETWDADRFRSWKSENGPFMTRVLDIAELPEQSVRGLEITRYYFIHSRLYKTFVDLLTASGRAAHESGDSASALRHYRAAMNVANHLDHVELPTLLAKTVAILTRQHVWGQFTTHLLPDLADQPATLVKWRDALSYEEDLATEWPRLVAGEWHIVMRAFILPAALDVDANRSEPEHPNSKEPDATELPEPREVIAAYTSAMREIRTLMDHQTPRELLEAPSIPHYSFEGYSRATQQYLDTFSVGWDAWIRGLLRSNSKAFLMQAAISIPLDETPPVEPITGRPFDWNPDTRTLSLPAEAAELDFDIDPIRVP